MVYEFKCNYCGNEFEMNQSIKDYTGEYKCEKCGNLATKDYSKIKPINYERNTNGFFGTNK